MRIKVFIETAVRGNNSIDPGPEPLAGLRHDGPVKRAHQHIHLLEQILGFVVRLCIDL
jgi:hypothetical protein